jgi:hypothetical protein
MDCADDEPVVPAPAAHEFVTPLNQALRFFRLRKAP